MKKVSKPLVMLLVLAMLAAVFPANVRAAIPGELQYMDTINSYAAPFFNMEGKGVVLGQSTTLQYYAHIVHPEVAYLQIVIWSGDENEPIEQYRAPIEQGCYAFEWTWNVPRDKYKVGHYQISTFVTDRNFNSLGGDYFLDVDVVPSAVPVSDLEIYWGGWPYSGNAQLVLNTDRNLVMCYALPKPLNATADRTFTYSSSDPSVLRIVEWGAGYVLFMGLKEGKAFVTAECGNLKRSIPVQVTTIQDLKIDRPMRTTICPGSRIFLTASARDFTYVNARWSTSDPNVLAPDPTYDEGSFIAMKPGVVTVTASHSGKSATIQITVAEHEITQNIQRTEPTCTEDGLVSGYCARCNRHDAQNVLPALGHSLSDDAERVEPTATQPGSATGVCTRCGQNATLVLPAIFADTPANAWYASYVDYVYERRIMNGTAGNTFSPESPLTRAMAATVLYRIAGAPEVEGSSPFSDVAAGTWYTDAVIWAQANGVVLGYTDGTFRPDRNITREQFATILHRYTKLLDPELGAGGALDDFPDASLVSNYAADAMRWAVGEGLITGVSTAGGIFLRPQNNTTRAQFATIVSRYLTALEAGQQPEEETQER